MADPIIDTPPSAPTSPSIFTPATAPDPVVAPVPDKAPMTAASKLRDFEDERFGKDISRINGEIERGVGSPYARMTESQKRHYASLENLVKAEKAVADASAALADAQAKHEAAVKASDDAVKTIAVAESADKAEADRVAAEAAKVKPAPPAKQPPFAEQAAQTGNL